MNSPKSKSGDTLPSARDPERLPDSELKRDTLPTTKPPEALGVTVPPTVRVCEPCDGHGCPWCSNGLQTNDQYLMWCDFRKRMRNISNTYSFVEEIVLDVLDRLNKLDTDEALVLALEGQRLLECWSRTNPVNQGRNAATEALKDFNRRALDYLTRW